MRILRPVRKKVALPLPTSLFEAEMKFGFDVPSEGAPEQRGRPGRVARRYDARRLRRFRHSDTTVSPRYDFAKSASVVSAAHVMIFCDWVGNPRWISSDINEGAEFPECAMKRSCQCAVLPRCPMELLRQSVEFPRPTEGATSEFA